MQKKVFILLLSTILPLLLLVAGTAQAENENALLWRIETPQGGISHLFGTIHSEDPRVLELPTEVIQALASAHTLVLEVDLGRERAADMGRAMLLPPEKNLQSLIGDKLYRQSVTAMADHGYTEAVVNRLQPWAIVLTLNMPKAETGLFLDYFLYLQALKQGMTVLGLEEMHEQLSVFTSLSLDEQITLLRDTLHELDALPQLFEQLTDAYLQRDLQALAEMTEKSSVQGSDTALQQRLMATLVDVRNQRMARRLLPMLEEGGVFVAIGAMHLPGESGLLALLQQRGLRLTPVY